MRFFLTLVLTLLTASGVRAQIPYGEPVPEDRKAFRAGEGLLLVVNYKIGILNTDVATVSFELSEDRKKDQKAYRIHAVGEMDPSYAWFFQMRDVYDSWIGFGNLRPIYFRNDLREGSYRFRSSYDYNWEEMKVYTTYRNLKRDRDSHKVMDLTTGSYDALALFYNLRCVDRSTFVPGQHYSLRMVLEDTIRTINYRYIGPEVKNIRGTGKFRTMKFACQLATSSGESFKDGDEFFVWFSDDRNMVPLYADVPIRVGSVRVRLVKYRDLKYPFESRIR